MREQIKLLNEEWLNLRRKYLPYSTSSSIWRYNTRPHSQALPEQGWKIHLSASLLTAGRMVESVAPFLSDKSVLFKAPATLDELIKINAGIFYGYSQIGKFITVYPANDSQFVFLVEKLDRLTRRFRCSPAVPFDFSYRRGSCVYYRFGSFSERNVNDLSDAKPFVDERENGFIAPSGIINPIPRKMIRVKTCPKNPLRTSYRIFRALTQRGKGGVYEAIDVTRSPMRRCIIKEGRKNGEMSWDGSDGFRRIEHERRVLSDLRKKQIAVPEIFDYFESNGNFYMVLEFIEGENFHKFLSRRKRRLPILKALEYGLQISRILSDVHSAGWVWRDCKPSNLILNKSGRLRPVDFEGTFLIGSRDTAHWTSPFFTPADVFDDPEKKTNLPEDLFALGVILYFLFEGSVPFLTVKKDERFLFKRRGLSAAIKQIITELLNPDPECRPSAEAVSLLLRSLMPIRKCVNTLEVSG